MVRLGSWREIHGSRELAGRLQHVILGVLQPCQSEDLSEGLISAGVLGHKPYGMCLNKSGGLGGQTVAQRTYYKSHKGVACLLP